MRNFMPADMDSLFITYKTSTIHYVRTGLGKSLLLCFHGYGESGSTFHFLENILGSDFTLIALDFPFHGETIWKEGFPFTVDDLIAILEQIAPSFWAEQEGVYLLGYSMGGKLALKMLEAIPKKIKKIILIAPDGLRSNFWYSFATQNLVGNRLFLLTMKRPGWFFLVLRLTKKTGLFNKSIFKFVNYYLHDKRVRLELYDRWMTMRKIMPDIKKVKANIFEYRTLTRLLYGKYDHIVRHDRAGDFMGGIEPFCKLSIVESGHQLLQTKNEDIIIELIKN
jgi:pimeloyl-ACP methyl ester carboxylesterase